ncbi:MAG: TonB-dependent receptor [Chitinophagaceae bacterium]|nr:TonB-dependent receptor [Chitinophagaceae bacterium]
MSRYLVMIICTCFTLTGFAQEENKDEKELDPITITGTLTPSIISKTGRNIIVVKGDQLNKLPVQSIDELIRYIPGVEVQSRGPMGAQSNITIRGGTFQQVLIILDGIRLNDPLTGHFNSYIPIAPSEIERIEILKGASSAVYGTEAVGGVVHIITKTFASRNQKNGGFGNAQLTLGEYGLVNLQAGGGFHKNKTTGSVGMITNNAKGQPLRGAKGYFNLTTLSASLKQEIGKSWSIAYRFGLDDRNFNAQNFYTARLTDTATEYVNSTWNHLKTEFRKNKHFVSLDLGSKKTLDEYRFNKSLNPNVNNSTLQQALLIYNYKVNDNSTITAGSQYINRKITSNDRGDHEVATAGFFGLLSTKIGKALFLNPGVRVDWNERSGWELLPQINANYRYEGFLFRAGVGRTGRDADFTERFNNYQRSNVPGGNRIGNPDLMSETSISYEFGVDYFLGKNFKIGTTWFERFHEDLIDYVRTPYANMPRQVNLVPGASYDLAKNISKVNTTGIETDIQYNQSFGTAHNINAGIGFIWMRSRSSDTIPSLYVSNHAKEFINFFAGYRYKSIGISVNGLFKERNPQTPVAGIVPLSRTYFLLNLRADVYAGKQQNVAFFIQADNLFDKNYSDILGSVMPGRWIMTGIKVNLP